MVADAPPVTKAIPEFLLFCRDDLLLGHNLMFDYKFTKVQARRLGLPFEKQGLDTLKIAGLSTSRCRREVWARFASIIILLTPQRTERITMRWLPQRFIR